MGATRCTGRCGNPSGVPLLFVHGGPGGGSLPHHRRFYDPAFWRIVLYDQRGAGRSKPIRRTDRQHDGAPDRRHRTVARAPRIDRWLLFGGRGDRRSRCCTRRPTRIACSASCCAACFWPRKVRSTGSCTACRASFPRHGAPSPHSSRRTSARDLLAQLLPAAHEPRIARVNATAPMRGTRYESACSTLLPKPSGNARLEGDARRARDRADRGALLRPQGVPSRTTRILGERAAHPTRALHHRPGSLRRHLSAAPRPTRWRARGRRPNTSSCRTPVTRCASRDHEGELVAAVPADAATRSSARMDARRARARMPTGWREAAQRYGTRARR